MNKKRILAPLAVGAAALTLGGVLTTNALFTDTATLGDNTFTTGVVDISTTPTTSALSATGMAPGQEVVAPITVNNAGSLPLRYAVEATATGTLPGLQLTIKTGVTTCTTAGFNATGTAVTTAAPLSATATKAVGDRTQGAQAGDRNLNAGVNETYCVKVALPLSADNTSANKTATVAFNFYAEQIANN